jgi:hypothetical protein
MTDFNCSGTYRGWGWSGQWQESSLPIGQLSPQQLKWAQNHWQLKAVTFNNWLAGLLKPPAIKSSYLQ